MPGALIFFAPAIYRHLLRGSVIYICYTNNAASQGDSK
jgi:hypothetical protein